MNRLQHLIMSCGFQRDLASKAGVSVKFVSAVYTGRKKPSPAILSALGITLEEARELSAELLPDVDREQRSCSVNGCERLAKTKGLCDAHYMRVRVHGSVQSDRPIRNGRSICSVENCRKMAVGRGLCHAHYKRYRKHGDPLAGKAAAGAALAWLQNLAKSAGTDKCVIWPFSITAQGYGTVLYRGRVMGAHRAACMIAHGLPLGNRNQAAHSCGNGSSGCVNPRHLRWATAQENSQDRYIHGTAGKLAPYVSAIRSSVGKISGRTWATKLGVNESTISRLRSGKTY